MSASPLLSITDLMVRYPGTGRPALTGVDLQLHAGQRLGVVGASGSGKSTIALAITGLLPAGTEYSGSIRLAGQEVVGAPSSVMRTLRREVVGLVFQDPVGALNPVRTVGAQLAEALQLQGEPKGSRRARALELLAEVGLDEPARVFDAYPHQISGGMAQRVGIALALTGEPDLLIADEPTTALDVITQRRILDLLLELSQLRGMSLLMVSHDLPVVASICEQVAVMAGGRIVESGDAASIFRSPRHEATRSMVTGVLAIRPSEAP